MNPVQEAAEAAQNIMDQAPPGLMVFIGIIADANGVTIRATVRSEEKRLLSLSKATTWSLINSANHNVLLDVLRDVTLRIIEHAAQPT